MEIPLQRNYKAIRYDLTCPNLLKREFLSHRRIPSGGMKLSRVPDSIQLLHFRTLLDCFRFSHAVS